MAARPKHGSPLHPTNFSLSCVLEVQATIDPKKMKKSRQLPCSLVVTGFQRFSLSFAVSLLSMDRHSFLSYYSQRRLSGLFKGFFFFIPTSLALFTSFLVLSYIYSTSNLFIHHHQTPALFKSTSDSPPILPALRFISTSQKNTSESLKSHIFEGGADKGSESQLPPIPPALHFISTLQKNTSESLKSHIFERGADKGSESQRGTSNGKSENNNDVFHDRDIFLEDYKEMRRSLKIYVYPHGVDDPFANVLLPVKYEPGGNYASESYFKKALMNSQFITKDPTKADLFFMPFSIASLRHDRRVGVGGIQDFIRDYILNISQKYPYWNRTGGADHFYVACHSVGRTAMGKAVHVKFNAIQVVCSSSYFLTGYIAHKDACLPQIWPRNGNPPNLVSSNRKKLAFFAGGVNSRERVQLVKTWKNDKEIFAYAGRLKTPYADELLGSKFCLHAKGYEVNTARIGDSLYYGCVPVVLADYYDLPFADVLNWKSFSVVVRAIDIPLLKKVLKGISSEEYLMLQSNVLKVRKHFQWHSSPVDFDAFYMVMYELWLRRSSIKLPF